ncbi:HAD family hydrolase [Paracoccus onubensis]|uniref:HAD family phosphatase n=1 Tax=Paracoccus onubensis TaxID=1675788 RepID=A0A418T8C0_9RHOB|nr:HAD family phosphatase [Paracoccus onubensis]RJE89417.1 HAD family phosphatase [Paracoccus onubensis]
MKHIVFDLGRVLIDWLPERAFATHFTDSTAIRDWMARVDFHGWNYLQDGGRPLSDGLAEARRAHGADAAPLENYTANFHLTIQDPVPGSWEIAETLQSAGHRLFAITNWSRDNWPAALAQYPRLETLFEDIVVSGVEGLLKPQPEIYRTLLDRNGIKAGNCVFIDDSPANVEGARAVGMEAIHFTEAEALHLALRESGI